MRELFEDICGEERRLAATFASSVEISEKVADPLLITREAAIESVMLSQGLSYSPKWRFTVQNIPMIIHIALKAGGEKLNLSDVQEWCFDVGFPHSQTIAANYIALLSRPTSEAVMQEGDSGDAPGE